MNEKETLGVIIDNLVRDMTAFDLLIDKYINQLEDKLKELSPQR